MFWNIQWPCSPARLVLDSAVNYCLFFRAASTTLPSADLRVELVSSRVPSAPLGFQRVARKSSEVPHLPCLQIVSSLGDTTVPLILGLWVFRDFPQEQSFFTYCHQGLLGKGTGESFSWSISLWSSWQGLGEWSARLVNMTDHLRMSNLLKF